MASRLCFIAFVSFIVTVSPLAAQNDTTRFDRWLGVTEYDGPRRLELSATAGYALSTEWSDLVTLQVADAQGGLHRQVLLRSVAVAPGAGCRAGDAARWLYRQRAVPTHRPVLKQQVQIDHKGRLFLGIAMSRSPHRSSAVQINIKHLIDDVQCDQTVRELR